jgi:hypothetical protein
MGAVAASAYALNDILDRQVERYGVFGRKTIGEMGKIAGEGIQRDIQRAGKIDDVMADYVRATFELDQSIENLKATITKTFGPALIDAIKLLTYIVDHLPGGNSDASWGSVITKAGILAVAEGIASAVPGIGPVAEPLLAVLSWLLTKAGVAEKVDDLPPAGFDQLWEMLNHIPGKKMLPAGGLARRLPRMQRPQPGPVNAGNF